MAEVEKEVEWIETSLIATLDEHAISLKVIARVKRWWSAEATVKQKIYSRTRRLY